MKPVREYPAKRVYPFVPDDVMQAEARHALDLADRKRTEALVELVTWDPPGAPVLSLVPSVAFNYPVALGEAAFSELA